MHQSKRQMTISDRPTAWLDTELAVVWRPRTPSPAWLAMVLKLTAFP